MFVKTSKKIIVISILLLICILTSYIFYKTSFIIKKINDNDDISCSVLLYSQGNVLNNKLDCYQIIYSKNTNCLKILSINTDMVLLSKHKKAKSLKTLFYEDLDKNLDFSIENFYINLNKILKDYRISDFYLNMSFESFLLMMTDKDLHYMILKDNFLNKDLKSLNNLNILECILKLMPFKTISILKRYSLINTNISKISFLSLVTKFTIKKPLIMFCELPVKYTKVRVDPDMQNIKGFLNKIYYSNNDSNYNNKNCFIDVENASGRPRMAQKVTWLLRENKFDVLDWSNFNILYKETLIKDFKGNFKKCLDICKILKTGKILVSYNNKVYYDISIFVGQDCDIYDNFDKTGGQDVKN
ncbi:MAG: LytR C-terminal domain-containing protein [Endomicrobium sp.]|uniref:LytR C-terminal domain-containing protein n=1 Tax=Candidatus Endomicrobiellum cubanum TaxID=3242325 RepID=UPI002838D94C|nr:LytR C-terminal domain-containing protein [Endomicrobium sp.]